MRFYRERESAGRYWVLLESYHDPSEMAMGPFENPAAACQAAAERCPWDFAENGGYPELPVPSWRALP